MNAITQPHTAGPWKATASYGELTDHPYLVWSVPRDRALAQCFRISESGEDNATEQAANAKLIASAPALHEALTALLTWVQAQCYPQAYDAWGKSAVERARAALDTAAPLGVPSTPTATEKGTL